MHSPSSRHTTVLSGLLLTVLCNTSAYADDTEIFTGNPSNAAAPNILFVLDTSGSMGSNVKTTVDYNPAQTYTGTGDCAGVSGRTFYATGDTPPSCSSGNWFPTTQLKCADALSSRALGAGGTGIYLGRFIRWGGKNNNRAWQSKFAPNNAADVECREDNGVDGNLAATNPYPTGTTSSSTTGVWMNNASSSYWTTGSGVAGTLYSANYVIYWNQHRTTTIGTRMSIMKNAAISLLNSLSGVNVGLMRYSRNGGDGDALASGGMVAYPISPIATSRTELIDAVNAYTANGYTPLSETLFESYRYFSGGKVLYGASAVPFDSVASSRTPATDTGTNYNSPADYSCQKNYIVYLTDGLPTADSEANDLIKGLPNFSTLGGTCEANGPSGDWPNAGLCLTPLSRYMFSADLRSDVAGTQNVTSYWIGFGDDVAGGTPFEYLQRAATAGGGRAYAAQDSAALTSVLTGIVTSILQTSTTFTAPTVAVNAFNRTRSLSDLYVSVFQPSADRHWPGNLKKYRVKATTDGAVIVGMNGDLPAIDDSTGYFVDGAQSFWSATPDGPRVRDGGAANHLPEPAGRSVYTFIGANPTSPETLSGNSAHAVTDANTTLTDAMLNLTGATGDPSRTDLMNWARGQDVLDEYPWGNPGPNGVTTERRFAMGDPIHAQPALVIYGGTTTSPDIDDATAFITTNDGYLHAISAATGIEQWAFIPQELLGELKDLYLNSPTTGKNYLLDGEIKVLKYDINGDGIVDPAAGDRVILYFGQGRGGSNYYALDVTDKTAPKFMWSIGAAQLPGIGLAWSTPAVTRVNISGATQNSQKLVLVIGGGYDNVEDNVTYVNADTAGNRIYIVDALRGTLLWSASASGANFNHARMTHSIPASISVLDTNSDGYADRMYTGDMAAQLWRFDIKNGNTAAALVTGGVIASLGSHEETTHTAANTRRFYNPPDVAAIQRPSAAPYLNIAIGSGYRGHPLDQTAHERFYSVRDFRPFSAMTQDEYNGLRVLQDSDLMDVTNDMAPALTSASPGWKITLNQPGGTWRGEKSLGQATTVNNHIAFTTYTPNTEPSSDPCAPTLGKNRAYAVNVRDGSPVHIDGEAGVEDRYEEFNFGGIATDISTMILGPEPEPCVGENCPPPCEGESCPDPNKTKFVCLAGVRVLDICRDFDSRVKTYWRETGAN